MPRISKYYGIAIYMYYRDHEPPHFHAIYGEHEAVIDIQAADVTEGYLPKRALSLVKEWAEIHKDELLNDWGLARAGQPLDPIPPLD